MYINVNIVKKNFDKKHFSFDELFAQDSKQETLFDSAKEVIDVSAYPHINIRIQL